MGDAVGDVVEGLVVGANDVVEVVCGVAVADKLASFAAALVVVVVFAGPSTAVSMLAVVLEGVNKIEDNKRVVPSCSCFV